MDAVIDQVFCMFCRRLGTKKRHSEKVPYCDKCKTDSYGHAVGTCGWCGVVKQGIVDNAQCEDCFTRDTRD